MWIIQGFVTFSSSPFRALVMLVTDHFDNLLLLKIFRWQNLDVDDKIEMMLPETCELANTTLSPRMYLK